MTIIELKSAKVLVSGASGYIGSHVCQRLLLNGYKVRGTVRNVADEEKVKKLKQQITENTGVDNLPELEIVEADLLKEDSWPAAIDGCDYICHVASPFPIEIPNDPDTIIKPAVEGTLNVLKAAAANPKIKRVVITSSIAAIHDTKILDGTEDPEKKFDENDWVDPDKVEPYNRSKILAEKAALKFVEDLEKEGKDKLELVFINPSFVLGPMITDQLSSSLIAVKRFLDRSIPVLPRFHMPICDVRDVAEAHVKALEGSEHVGKRYLIVSDCKWMKDVGKLIQKEFKPLGYFVPTMVAPSTLVWLGSFFDKTAVVVVPRLDKEFKLDNKKMVEELKVSPTEVDKTIIDCCHSLVEKGIVKATKKYKRTKSPKSETSPDEAATTTTQAQTTEAAGGDA